MKQSSIFNYSHFWALFLLLSSMGSGARADVITDWNVIARNIVVQSKIPTPPANRVMAIAHTAVYEAINSITQEFPQSYLMLRTVPGASLESAVASANYTSLLTLLPKQRDTIEKAYLDALKMVPDGAAKSDGVVVGEKVAHAVLANRLNDGSNGVDGYRPYTTAGNYVPTVIPAAPHWPNRKPWILNSASQFRPGPPPALGSKIWAKDFNEVKVMGAKSSPNRTQDQTDMAKFWEATLPPIYHGVVHSVAAQAGRTPTQNARLFALVTQASDDALIAVFEAKYHYGFWRPITAIRNADIDGNQSTKRDASWAPFISTPMHPEYPCAHCVVAATVGSILKAEVGSSPMPVLKTRSVTANGAMRSWLTVEDFVQEVSNARIYDGVHYRTSTDVGNAMGRMIGENAIKKFSLGTK